MSYCEYTNTCSYKYMTCIEESGVSDNKQRHCVSVYPIYSRGIPGSLWQKQRGKEICSKGVMDELLGSRNSTSLQNSLAFTLSYNVLTL